jgi:hypothetical protein
MLDGERLNMIHALSIIVFVLSDSGTDLSSLNTIAENPLERSGGGV